MSSSHSVPRPTGAPTPAKLNKISCQLTQDKVFTTRPSCFHLLTFVMFEGSGRCPGYVYVLALSIVPLINGVTQYMPLA